MAFTTPSTVWKPREANLNFSQIVLRIALPRSVLPADGLSGKTDEEKIGVPYSIINKYIRTGVCLDKDVKEKIDILHEKNAF